MVILSYRLEYINPVHDLVASDPKLKSLIQYAMKVIGSDLYAFGSLLSRTVYGYYASICICIVTLD